MEYFRLLLEHLAWIEHEFFSGIRDSRKAGSLWGMMRGVGGVRKSIHRSWLGKGLGLGLLCWGFREFRKRFLTPCDFCLFPKLSGYRYETIEEMKEAVMVIDTLTQEDFHGTFQLFERHNKCIAAGGDYFGGDWSFMCVLSIKVPIRKKSGNLFNDPRISTSTLLENWKIMEYESDGDTNCNWCTR